MRRITKISINNYKAYIRPFEILLPKGENLLIYGENGSGKSSFYKAIKYFLESSVNQSLKFELNHFSGNNNGSISISYSNVDSKGTVLVGTEQTYTKSVNPAFSNNTQNFIKTSYRASGFLDYSKLLKVYLNDSDRPNLFSLVFELLDNFVSPGFDTRTLRELYNSILYNITTSYHRKGAKYQKGLNDYRKFQQLFLMIINDLNVQLHDMISNHFNDLGLDIELEDVNINLDVRGRIRDTKLRGEVYLKVIHHGNNLPNYNQSLNEARLSAIATCLYLSSLKLIANTNDTRVLFLDDVFIGLDLGNRLPVLEIVKEEFKHYQRVITTYDKSWFAQAKEALSKEDDWFFYEMYEGEFNDEHGNIYNFPIIVNSESSYGRACAYLFSKEHPDYPAATNYLRKAFEELLQNQYFDKAIRNGNYSIIPAFKLTNLVNACSLFVIQLHDYIVPQKLLNKYLSELSGLLHPLLHPLSHYVPDIPIYKNEIKKCVKIYESLKYEIAKMDYHHYCRVVWEKGNKFEFVVKGQSGWINQYTLLLEDNLYIYIDNKQNKRLSSAKMRVVNMQGKDILGNLYSHQVPKKSKLGKLMKYDGLVDCYNKILFHIKNNENKTDSIIVPLGEMYLFPDANNNNQQLNILLSNIVW